jgi:hypothetical protein
MQHAPVVAEGVHPLRARARGIEAERYDVAVDMQSVGLMEHRRPLASFGTLTSAKPRTPASVPK